MCRCPSRLIACALAALVLAGPVRALPGDEDLPIRIEADEALRDENQGFTRYDGNVKLDQGSLHIEADELTVHHTGEDAKKIEARGRPATMRQQPDPDKGVVTASARTIVYFRDEARVELREDASIVQDGSTVNGDMIDYLIDQKLVKAESKKGEDSNRVQVVIPAQTVQQAETNRNATKTRDPNQPAATDPNQPAATDPNRPEVADPNAPEAADPNQPVTGDPNQPQAADPNPVEAADGTAGSQ